MKIAISRGSYNGGKIYAREKHVTTGEPVKLVLRLENEIKSVNDVAIITCYTVDGKGNFVPTAPPLVSFHSNPYGKIISTGSSATDHTPLPSLTRKMYAGLISVAAGVAVVNGNPVGEHGVIEIFAHAEGAEGLKSAKLTIEI